MFIIILIDIGDGHTPCDIGIFLVVHAQQLQVASNCTKLQNVWITSSSQNVMLQRELRRI